jgi:tetratricopeptide (TPR) repeat protein
MGAIKSKILFTLCLSSFLSKANGQADLVFNKRFVECEDRWVALPSDSTGSHSFGFIYIDQTAGLTLEHTGSFRINNDGSFSPLLFIDSLHASFKVRLQNNNVKVAIIPDTRLAQLKIEAIPDWLSIYKTYRDTARRLQRWGYMYNDWGMSEKALEYLEPGYNRYPDYKGMAVELSFAYNALEKFEQAIPVLKKTIELIPNDWYLYKELSYALLQTDKLQEAGEAAMKGIGYASQDAIKAEMAYNLAYKYYKKTDKANFSHWADEALKWTKKGDQFYNSIKAIESKLN